MCVRFNADWLPYVLGGLFQLVNPSSWLVDTSDELQSVLERATSLLDNFGKSVDCPPMQLRFTDTCLLQSSVDGGITWLDVPGWATNFPVCNPPQTQVKFDADCLLTESFDGGETFEAVPGWAANFKDCVISNAPIIGLPPNPGDESKDQFACSIAAYLADQVILLAMQKAVNAIQDDLTLLVFGANVLTIIPEFILVAAAYDAFAAIYGAVAEGTLAHYEAAIADDVLWNKVKCAIYTAIRTDGYVTPGNFAAILSNLGSIIYTYSDVVSAIVAYVTSLGATGLAQLSQRAGLLVGSDCSDCSTGAWCAKWGSTFEAISHDWTCWPGEEGPCGTPSGNNWVSVGIAGHQDIFIQTVLDFPATIHRARIDYSGSGTLAFSWEFFDESGTSLFTTDLPNWDSGGGSPIANVKKIQVALISSSSPVRTCTNIEIAGPSGGSPWGLLNCAP